MPGALPSTVVARISSLGKVALASSNMTSVFEGLTTEHVQSLVSSDTFRTIVTVQDGSKLAFAIFGDPNGVPIVFFPGLGVGRVLGIVLHRAAKANGFLVLSLDRPGIGLSSDHKHPNRTKACCDRLRHALRELNIDKICVAGHCAGAVYAQAATVYLHDLVKGPAVLFSPWVSPSLKGGSAAVRFASKYIPAPLLHMGTFLSQIEPWVASSAPSIITSKMSPAEQRSVVGEVGSYALKTIMREVGGGNQTGVQRDLLMCLQRGDGFGFSSRDLHHPLVIFHGTADSIVPLKAVVSYVEELGPTAELHVEQDATHGIFMDASIVAAAFKVLLAHKAA